MIHPEEIKTKASRMYLNILSSSVQGTLSFPIEISFGKIKANETLENFSVINNEIKKLRNESKEKKGYGYSTEYILKNDRKIGKQYFPSRIYFEDLNDYLKFLHKEKEYHLFMQAVQQIIAQLPQLQPWIESNPKKVLDNIDNWNDIIKVCRYFIECPKPNIYIRELPLDISTKFVEENEAIIRTLLDILIGEHLNKDESDFKMRFNLKYSEPLIRLRILDYEMAQELFSGVDDLSIPQSQFNKLNIPCSRVFILENKTNYSNIFNFLSLPVIKDSISIFGKGFGIGVLKNAVWLSNKQIIYWGDIDAHGFQILSQIRGYFPQTQSCMMDFETFREFKNLAVTGTDTKVTALEYLTPEEHELFEHLINLKENNRLEQEKIPHAYALKNIHEIVNSQ
ncbi:Wadjet anti-phage system protein JetD domain-containing protein [Methanolobus psychrotolerans]|uniref:Wadjet anti-phage system protein JetD domain-containing protein n=1 Tax=Methanolobus psychrotolerans TaxID=1874706 RepID=UPI000B915897|nr:Wadjet anti-phage system protein JetD domain-containing protein [Methanolobus psychrotolerans]